MGNKTHKFLLEAVCPSCGKEHEVVFNLTLPDTLVPDGKFTNCKLDLPKIEANAKAETNIEAETNEESKRKKPIFIKGKPRHTGLDV